MELSAKQTMLMKVIVNANPDGSSVDLDQILERLEYRTTKQSLQFSLRALIQHGIIKKNGSEVRRGRERTLIAPTEMGIRLFKTGDAFPKAIQNPVTDTVAKVDIDTDISEILESI